MNNEYFISFVFSTKDGDNGNGNSKITINGSIGFENIEKFQNDILLEYKNFKSVCVMFYSKIEN